MKNSTTRNTSYTNAFARITKCHKLQQYESKRADQSAYDAICALLSVDASIFAAPQGFATWTTERQMACVASDFAIILN